MTALFAGALLGVAGSAHCALMCGPLALTMTSRRPSPAAGRRWPRTLVYHLGRTAAYLLLALPAAVLGTAASLAGAGRVLSIAMGLALLAGVIRGPGSSAAVPRRITVFIAAACTRAAAWQQHHGLLGAAVAGAANGVLPCGLVYTAVAASLAMGSVRDSLALMAGFGLGTMPMLIGLSMSSQVVPAGFRRGMGRLRPAAVVLVAALLIYRGAVPPGAGTTHHEHVEASPAHR